MTPSYRELEARAVYQRGREPCRLRRGPTQPAHVNLLWFAAVLRTTLADAGQDGWGAAAMASSAVLGGLFLLLIAVGAALAYSIAGSGNRYLGLTPSATEKMACSLLESAVQGKETPKGIRFNLTELRTKMLISTIGPSVLIRNKPALEAMVVALTRGRSPSDGFDTCSGVLPRRPGCSKHRTC
jgi:hypothetical protein